MRAVQEPRQVRVLGVCDGLAAPGPPRVLEALDERWGERVVERPAGFSVEEVLREVHGEAGVLVLVCAGEAW